MQMASSISSDSPWASQFTERFDLFSGYVKDEISAYELIKTYEVATTSRFTVFKQTGGFKDLTLYSINKVVLSTSVHI